MKSSDPVVNRALNSRAACNASEEAARAALKKALQWCRGAAAMPVYALWSAYGEEWKKMATPAQYAKIRDKINNGYGKTIVNRGVSRDPVVENAMAAYKRAWDAEDRSRFVVNAVNSSIDGVVSRALNSFREVVAANAPKFGTPEYDKYWQSKGATKLSDGHYTMDKSSKSGKSGGGRAGTEKGDDGQKSIAAAAGKDSRFQAMSEAEQKDMVDVTAQLQKMMGKKDITMEQAAKRAVQQEQEVDEALEGMKEDDPSRGMFEGFKRQIEAAKKFLGEGGDGQKEPKEQAGEGPEEPKGEEPRKEGDAGDEGKGDIDENYSGTPDNEHWDESLKNDENMGSYEPGDNDFSEKAILAKGVSKAEYDEMSKIVRNEMVTGVDENGNKIMKPVSAQFRGIVTALMCGIDVPDETITSMPEWKEAQRKCNEIEADVVRRGGVAINDDGKSVVQTRQINTKERKRGRGKLFQQFMSDTMDETVCEAVELKKDENGKPIPGQYVEGKEPYKVKQGHEIHIITGLPSAGKSSVFANRLCRELGARLTDCDAIKQKLPEFNGGLGANAVHEESSCINDAVVRESQKRGDNIVYPMLGKDEKKLLAIKAQAEAHGYKVVLHYNDVPPAKAKGRMLNRFLSTGRFMNPVLVSKPGYRCRKAFDAVKDKFDNVEAVSNDVRRGEKPRLLYRKP